MTNLASVFEKAERVVTELRARGFCLATAESCTGGLVSTALTSVPGSSDVFGYGFVSYADRAKVDLLSVPQSLLDSHGAVSAEVADAMAVGALTNTKADLAVSITGIAGPSGGSPKKPVGLVFMAVAQRRAQPTRVARHQFKGDRHSVRMSAALVALDAVLSALNAPATDPRS